MFSCQCCIWPILCQFMAILAKLLDMDFKFVFPCIYINFDLQTKFEVNQTEIGQSIPKNTPKTHQSGHISKPNFAQVSFTKKPTPPTFFNEFFWNGQNQCKYGFCILIMSDFWFRPPKKIWAQNSKTAQFQTYLSFCLNLETRMNCREMFETL